MVKHLEAYTRQDHSFIAPIRDGQHEETQELLGLMVVGGVEAERRNRMMICVISLPR